MKAAYILMFFNTQNFRTVH